MREGTLIFLVLKKEPVFFFQYFFWMSLFSLPLVSASSLLFLLFWFSPVILHCPYYTGGINVTLDKGVTLNSLDYGNYGNHIQCARNAFEEAVRCRTKLKIPNFKLFSNPDPPFLGFDFRKVDPTVLEDYECKRVDVGACGKKHFFFHFQRPSLTPNQTMAVWECMGDLVNTDTLHECPNLENKLLIHIRNGDVLKIPNYLQPPFSSLLTTIYAKRFSFSFFFFIDLILYFSKQIQDGMNWWSYLPTEIHSQKGVDQSLICSML